MPRYIPQIPAWQPATAPIPQFTGSTSFIHLPPELLIKIFNHLTDSKDALCLSLVFPTFRAIYPLTQWPKLSLDVRSLRCRLQRDLKDPASARLYYCRLCTTGTVPCEKHGVEAVASMEKWRAYRRVNGFYDDGEDAPLRERVKRILLDDHRYCCLSRG